MTGQFILADVTSHRRGFGVQPIIDAAARRAETHQHIEKIIWLVPTHLMMAFKTAHGIEANHEIRNCDIIGPPLWDVIRKEIEVASASPGCQVTVVTWDQFIYAETRSYGHGVIAEKWFDWLAGTQVSRFSGLPIRRPPATQSSTTLPSVEDLQHVILAYLRSMNATEKMPMYRSQLRPALIRANPELRPASLHPIFASTFKAALDSAVAAKLIGESRPIPGKEIIWAASPAPVPQPAAPAPAAVIETPVKAPESRVPTPPTYERSAEFRSRLTGLGIFCEKRERDILLEALAELLKTGPYPISRLRRELPKAAAALAKQRNVCTQTAFPRIVNFFIKLLLMSGALKAPDGEVIPRNVGSDAARAASLADDATDLVESYLLEQILKLSDVKDREHWQLALALFREFDQASPLDDKLDRIAVLIAGLSDRIALTNEGTYDYIAKTPHRIQAVRTSA
jgi:hypothetical protein